MFNYVNAIYLFWGLAATQVNTQSTVASDSYRAAVVEYSPFTMHPEYNVDPALLMRKNAINYIYFMEQAARQGADIVVFPECGLTGITLPESRPELQPFLTEIPDPNDRPNPCLDPANANTSQILKDLSCASRRNGIYSVMNLPERSPCLSPDGETLCPDDCAFIYNTNIAFDRDGALIARYRKFNLYLEPGFDTQPTAEQSMFDTDFGVRFGMFICFDILFFQPAVPLVTEHNITDIVYSTAWFSELPFLTAVQAQAGWSYTTNTNFLASGYNNPPDTNTGSGIFAGRDGVVASIMAFDELSKMLVATIKKKSRTHEVRATNAPPAIRSKRGSSGGQGGVPLVTTKESGSLKQFSRKLTNYLTFSSFFKSRFQGEKCIEKNSVNSDGFMEYDKYNGMEEDNSRKNIAKRHATFETSANLENDNNRTVKNYRKFKAEVLFYNTALLDLPNSDHDGNHNESIFLCHMSLCCTFTISTKYTLNGTNLLSTNAATRQFYRVGVFDGRESYDYQTCLVMQCHGPELETCKEEIDSSKSHTASTIFKEINIDGNFRKHGKIQAGSNVIFSPNHGMGANEQRYIMRNEDQIRNLTIFSLYVDGFCKEGNQNASRLEHLKLYQDEDLRHYNNTLLGSENVNKNLQLCQGSLCCDFYIGTEEGETSKDDGVASHSKLTSSKGYYFRIGVFDGIRSFLKIRRAGLQVCALFACTGIDIGSCGLLYPKNVTVGNVEREAEASSVVQGRELNVIRNGDDNEEEEGHNGAGSHGNLFKRIQIKGNFQKGNFITPSTVTTQLAPLGSDRFVFNIDRATAPENGEALVTMATTNSDITDIFTFGIYARDFGKDSFITPLTSKSEALK